MSRARDIADGQQNFVNVTGDTMTGALAINAAGNDQFRLTDGTQNLYMDTDNNGVAIAGGAGQTLGGLYLYNSIGAVSLFTNSALRMTIDSAGRVTMPYQPAFRAVVGNEAYLTTNPVPFGTTTLNVGNHFNTSTYTFTAPVSGTYFISVGLYLRTDNNEDIGPTLRINGTTLQYAYLYNSGTGGRIDSTGVIAVVTSLSANDAVSVGLVTASGEYFGGSAETYFSGYLIG